MLNFKRSQQLVLLTMFYNQTKLTQLSNQYQHRRHIVIALGARLTTIYHLGHLYFFQRKEGIGQS